MPNEHDWVLHGPIKDISLIRNKFAYELSRKLGNTASRTQFCELIINHEYLGIYTLTESIKRDKNRVKLKKNSQPDNHLSSYLIKIDKGGDLLFRSKYRSEIDSGWWQYFYSVYPKEKNFKPSQRKQIKNDINTIEKAFLLNVKQLDQININSFIDYFIVNELTRNIDAYRLSTFMHKNIGEKLTIGPVWDFNYSLGLTKYNQGYNPEGWVYKGEAVPFWWDKLLQNDEFKSKLTQRWFELRKKELNLHTIYYTIDNYILELEPALERNFNRWDVFDNHLSVRKHMVLSHDEEIELIKKWIAQRLNWIDEQMELY